jgi:hypothetical protein
MSSEHPSRRDLLKGAALASAGLVLGSHAALAQGGDAADGASTDPFTGRPSAAATMAGVPFEKHGTVRIAIVGTGLRGRSVLHELLGVPNVRITALCDTVPEKVEMAVQQMRKAGHDYEPARFTSGPNAYEQLVRRDDIDIVYTATPWEWHVPVCLAALNAGKHAATEVPAAYTLEDCWKLVDASERTRRHCLMMENCNYGYNELLVLQMVKAGAFGDLKHAGAAYNHDLREILFENKDEGLWRRRHHTLRNANLYTTHGLGPVAFLLGINRGDRFDYMVSMATPEMGLTKWRKDHEPADSPKWKERYVTGDLNISLIKTAKGRTIRLEHDVSSPRPYSRINSDPGDQRDLRGLPGAHLHRGGRRRTPLGLDRRVQGQVRAPALARVRGEGAQRRARRDGLRDGLPPGAMPARGARPGLRRLRRRGVVGPRAVERAVGRQGERADEVPGLHAGEVERGPGVALAREDGKTGRREDGRERTESLPRRTQRAQSTRGEAPLCSLCPL